MQNFSVFAFYIKVTLKNLTKFVAILLPQTIARIKKHDKKFVIAPIHFNKSLKFLLSEDKFKSIMNIANKKSPKSYFVSKKL